MKRVCLALFVLSLTGGAASAEVEGKVVYQKKTSYEFDADEVTGTVVRPDEGFVSARYNAKMPSLVNKRGTFVRELVKSAEDF